MRSVVSASTRRRARRERLAHGAFALAAWSIPVAFVLVPMLGFLAFSFWLREGMVFVPALSLANYERWFADPIYLKVFVGTLWLALRVTALCLIVGYPIAWLITRSTGPRRSLMLTLIAAPLFISFVLKLYALRELMGSRGYLAQMLEATGLSVPVTALLFNQTSVMITMVLVYLPFVVLPVYATLAGLPENLSAASADLGARPGQTFWRVTFPLSLPGTLVGAIFVFVLAGGDYVTPQMMGGTRGFTYGKLVWSQFGTAFEWPFGAAMAMMLFIVSVVAIVIATWLARRGSVAL